MTEPTTSLYLLIQTTTPNADLPDPGCALVALSPAYLAEMASRVEAACASRSTIRCDDTSPDLCDFTVDYSWPDFVRGAFQVEPDIRHFAVVAANDLPELTRSDVRVRLSALTVNSLGHVQWTGERGAVKAATDWIAWAGVSAAIEAAESGLERASVPADLIPLLCEP